MRVRYEAGKNKNYLVIFREAECKEKSMK